MGRIILSIIAGIAAGIFVVFMVELISTSMYPPPADLDLSDPVAMAGYVSSLPTGAFIIVILAHTLGAGAAGFVAAMVSRSKRLERYKHGLIAAGLILFFSIINFFTIPHPIWVIIVDLLLIIAVGMMGSRFGAARQNTI